MLVLLSSDGMPGIAECRRLNLARIFAASSAMPGDVDRLVDKHEQHPSALSAPSPLLLSSFLSSLSSSSSSL